MTKFEKVRQEQFPITARLAYLDTSSSGLISKNARDAMVNYLNDRYENAFGITGVFDAWAHADAMRSAVAAMFNAEPEEIFFGGAASTIINVFSAGIQLKENANVVMSGLSFPSTPYTWMNRVGAENVRIAQPINGGMPAQKLFDLVDENTAVISLCSVENTTGFRHDLKEISAFCQARGIYLVLDITQGVASMKIDVQETPIDFMVSSTFKWLGGPFGFGFGYVSKRVLDKIAPVYVGWTGNKKRFDHGQYVLDLNDGAGKFESGMLQWESMRGLEEAIKLYMELGRDDVEAYILSLVDYLYEQLESVEQVSVLGNFEKKHRSGIVYINFPAHWELNNDIMAAHGIRANRSGNAIRTALHYYNNKADIDKLVAFLKSYQ
ncbi:MAG: aminotransferase class V-fold PLP-dependent enzyme [Oscillospiraceae bacterium]|nr:aminotransferase class V-fold PLP-dependent enzyme [Oscillospiraceae bacterium]